MGPMIILDKSALQALSKREVDFLSYHYTIVVTPVLVAEILADLAKGESSDLPREMVRYLADKLKPVDSHINLYHRWICLSDLLGRSVPMDGRPVLGGAVPVRMKDGTTGIFIDEPPEAKAIMRWRQGNFTEQDLQLAQEWREEARAIDLESQRRIVREVLGGTPIIKDFNELGARADEMLLSPDPNAQHTHIRSLMEAIRVPQDGRRWVLDRWQKAGQPLFKDFAPYAYYCARANLIFALGVVSGLVSTRPTNRIDLEYLYYLPFCYVFCSGDTLHIGLSVNTSCIFPTIIN